MDVTKLDTYDYIILPDIIRIELSGTNDPALVDIMSELSRSDGRIYVEGYRYIYLDNYRLFSRGGRSFIELDVKQVS